MQLVGIVEIKDTQVTIVPKKRIQIWSRNIKMDSKTDSEPEEKGLIVPIHQRVENLTPKQMMVKPGTDTRCVGDRT